jgi:hypothetical protein
MSKTIKNCEVVLTEENWWREIDSPDVPDELVRVLRGIITDYFSRESELPPTKVPKETIIRIIKNGPHTVKIGPHEFDIRLNKDKLYISPISDWVDDASGC